ncbi:MAG: 2-hydroxyacid dehydrogenase [Atopobiaceae bacterium]|jgi:D-3-phosphoglycerate dehydrogenase|nr:2-hydroxyacid dehydrogenase [Atopobiaceae bacterium]MCH4120508.1 2-hydroxyacid dehydrogenase [Atopobiaceae bacterium]MCI1318728.1 2-hydroxyacid dehydrogenase [Atopobiaceae bacterium]MCI1388209.1 2-hydroxyacid dehydrogenase [Atopobiaceae bacterium]MCI1431541.1 2-hydroxyacid dehydrogenase [Atopobiaceae bacterium]
MFEELLKGPQRVVAVGDIMVAPSTMTEAVRGSKVDVGDVTELSWVPKDTDEFAERQLNIEHNGPEAEPYADGLDEAIADADVLITHFSPVPASLIAQAPNLKLIATCRGGMEHIDVDAATKQGIPVVNVIRNAVPVAEFAVGLIIAATRDIAISHHSLMQGVWEKRFSNSDIVTTLDQLTCGLVGVGNVGIELAWRLRALGMKVIAWDPWADRSRLEKAGLGDMELVDDLDVLLKGADVVSLHLRLTEQNAGMADASFFAKMKPTSYFINTARGGLVDYDDLAKALSDKTIAGAALDVFDSEPLSPSSPLLGLDNVTMTPHIAGQTVDAIPRSPFMLFDAVDHIIDTGDVTRIVNAKALGL